MLYVFALALSALLAPATGAQADSLRGQQVLACDDANEWPPYSFYRRVDGRRSEELTGYTVELLRRIAQRRGFQLEIRMLPWKRCVEAVRQGELQLLLNAIRTPERERDFWISSTIYETELLALWSSRRHPEGLGLRQQADLATWRVGGLHGYSYSQLPMAIQADMLRAPNYRSLLQMLQLGRIDVALVNEAVLLGHAVLGLGELADEQALGRSRFADREPSRFHFMATRATPTGRLLQQAIDAELPLMERSGELAALRARFLR